jgi:hypothetical protein
MRALGTKSVEHQGEMPGPRGRGGLDRARNAEDHEGEIVGRDVAPQHSGPLSAAHDLGDRGETGRAQFPYGRGVGHAAGSDLIETAIGGLQRARPQLANAGAAAAAARAYLECLSVSLAGTAVYAGLLMVGGLVGHSDSARAAAEKWGPDALPTPLDPDDLAAALWNLYEQRDRFEELVA